ncbi:MAG: hypothetical protein H0W64_02980 [Gammaproteobacteria bacterium]|nr:hypothetical protein [Gammaproteobacteria bacterium]
MQISQILLMTLLTSISLNSNAVTVRNAHVPFNYEVIQSGKKFNADYRIEPNQIIECFENGIRITNQAVLSWTYTKIRHESHLPAQLKINTTLQGELADPQGTLTIGNVNGKDDVVVSCVYKSGNENS